MAKQHDKQFKLDAVQYYRGSQRSFGVRMQEILAEWIPAH